MSNQQECGIPESELFTREHVIKVVAGALLNVSKDLYNLGLDDLSSIALTMGDRCLSHIGPDKDSLVYPREPNTPFVLKPTEMSGSVTCRCEKSEIDRPVQCNGHQNPGDVTVTSPQRESSSSIESEVSEIVTQIRREKEGQ